MCDIMRAFYSGEEFSWKMYQFHFFDLDYANLLKSGTRYYHKNLLVMSKPPTVTFDIDKGTITSHENEFYVEPRASYTMYDLVSYFYTRTGTDESKEENYQFNRPRVSSFFYSLLKRYSIDNLLFMIEAAGIGRDNRKESFNIKNFTDFNSNAAKYINNIKENANSAVGGGNYVIRKRVLPR